MPDIITLTDGTKIKVPSGLNEAELDNALALAMPMRMAKYGVFYDLEKEYNTTDGVGDAGARFDAAISRGNPEETNASLDESFGEGNWGITPNTTLPYVTPEGLIHAGIEPKDDRKVLLKGSDLSVYDLIDISPELAIGASALVAELVPLPGTGAVGSTAARGVLSMLSGRGLVARSGRAGLGAGAGSLGVEGVQSLKGDQKESMGEILSRAGAETALVGLGSLVLGAPLLAVSSGASRAIGAAKGLSKDVKVKPLGAADIEGVKAAQRNVASTLEAGGNDAILLSLRTLLGPDPGGPGSILIRLEGLGAQQLKGKIPDTIRNAMNNAREVFKASAGLSDEVTLQRLKTYLTKQEQSLLVKTVKQLDDFPNSLAGKLDGAATSLASMKKYADERLNAQFKRGMVEFEKLYAPFNSDGALASTVLNEARLSGYMNSVSKNTGIIADDILQTFERVRPALAARIRSRVEVNQQGNVIPVKLKKSAKTQLLSGNNIKNPFVGSDITVKDLLDADRAIRGNAFKATSRQVTHDNVRISEGSTKSLTEFMPEKLIKEFGEVNAEYSKFASLYTGKNGLFKRLGTESAPVSADKYLQDFVGGKTEREISQILTKLEDAFGPASMGSSAASRVKDAGAKNEMLSAMGFHFIRESKDNLRAASANDVGTFRSAAKRELSQIVQLEATLKKRLGTGSSKKVREAINNIFGLDSIKEYKTLLRVAATGQPRQAQNALSRLEQVMSFKEADEFVGGVGQIGDSLSTSNLALAVDKMRRLEQLDPKAGDLYRQMVFSENWSKVINSADVPTDKASGALKAWADDWVKAIGQPGGRESVEALMPSKQIYNDMTDLALTAQGALDIDPMSGALSTAEIIPQAIKSLLRGDFRAAIKPLSYMFATKRLAPYSEAWKALNRRLMETGKLDPEAIAKEMSSGRGGAVASSFRSAMTEGRKAADLALSGKNGLLAASVANYMNEAEDMYPSEYEINIRTLAEEKEPVVETAPVEAPVALPTNTGIDAIQQIAQMLQSSMAGTGTDALKEGARMARASGQ